MKITPFKQNIIFTELNQETITKVLSECFSLIEGCKEVIKWTLPKEVFESKYGEAGSEYVWDQLEGLEVVYAGIQYSRLEVFKGAMSGTSDVINRRTKNAVAMIQQLQEKLEAVTIRFLPLNEEQMTMFQELAGYILGDLAFFVFYQFDLDRTETCIKENIELEINVYVARYMDVNNLDINKILVDIKAVMETYRPTFGFFEEYPDLEEPFYEKAGAYAMDFEAYRDFITVEHVQSVISGEKPVEQILFDLAEEAK